MYFIFKDCIDNYRYAIAKMCFLKEYKEFKFVKDIANSNCMKISENISGKVMVVSLFSKPDGVKKEIEDIQQYYQKSQYTRLKNKKKLHKNIHKLKDSFDNRYNQLFELAIKDSENFMNVEVTPEYLVLFDQVIFKDFLFEKGKETCFKYYAQDTIQSKKYGVVDGSVSFSDPNTFNDPFDVNCFFANGSDVRDLFRILCVAPTCKEILMWSYYGSDHKGYCFEYNMNDILKIICNLKKPGICIIGGVNYTDKRPNQKSKLNRISISEVKFYIQAAFSKYTDWKHEKEIRFVIISHDFLEEESPYLTCKIPIVNVYEGCNGEGRPISNSAMVSIPTVQEVKDANNYMLHT